MAMASVFKNRFAFARTIERNGLCLQLKRSGTEYAAKQINFLTSTVANDCLWPTYVKNRFAFARTMERNGLCLQLKRSGTEYAAKQINSLTSTVANDRPLSL